MEALGAKGFGTVIGKNAFTTIFLQVNGFSVPVHDILPEAIRNLKEQAASNSLKEYDTLAMLGHRIGMLENSSGIKQYLQDIGPSLRPDGGLVFTSIDISKNPDSPNRPTPVYHNLQIQQANLIGPFFAMLRIKVEVLKNQAIAADWQIEMLYRQDENNYAARLSPL